MIVTGIDPGTTQSAWVSYNGAIVTAYDIQPNEDVLGMLRADSLRSADESMVCEWVESYGMAVGKEVFETVFWIGRFAEAWSPSRYDRLPRRVIKQHFCHTARATDANIRQVLIDRFGGQEAAIGRKSSPGPLYGIKSHCWSALAVAICWHDTHHADGTVLRPGTFAEF